MIKIGKNENMKSLKCISCEYDGVFALLYSKEKGFLLRCEGCGEIYNLDSLKKKFDLN